MKAFDDWDAIDDNNDTIKLLVRLRDLCYRDNNHKVCPPLDLLKKTKKAINGRQDESKSLGTYIEEAKIKYEVLKSVGGAIISDDLIKYIIKRKWSNGTTQHTYENYHMVSTSAKIKKEIEQAASQIMIACILIEGSNDKAHRNLRQTLQDSYTRYHDYYPTTPSEALEFLKQYQVQLTKTPKKPNDKNKDAKDESKGVESKTKNPKERQFVQHGQNESKNESGAVNVMASDPDPVNKVEFVFCTTSTEEKICNTDSRMTHTNIEKTYAFAQKNKEYINPNWILLDSQASCNVICNPDLVTDIWLDPDGRQITIHYNAGRVVIKQIATFRGFGTVWFHPNGIANCLSLAKVSDSYRITLDTEMSQAFYVHKDDGSTRRFDRMDCDLHACDVTKTDGTLLAITTVEGQKKQYSDLDVKQATRARKLQNTLGFPSLQAYMNMVDNNLILNCPVTRRDIAIAQDIFGVNVNEVLGKTVRRQPGYVREEVLPVPPTILKNYGDSITISIDIFHVNDIKFFRSISHHLYFWMTTAIKDAKNSTILECLKQIFALYSSRGLKIRSVHGDNEFECVSDDILSTFGATFHPVARGAHAPYIERDIRTSKERCRCSLNPSLLINSPDA